MRDPATGEKMFPAIFAKKPEVLRAAFYEYRLSIETLRRERQVSFGALIAALTSPASLQSSHYDHVRVETPKAQHHRRGVPEWEEKKRPTAQVIPSS